jgi:hypothetical protein
VGSGKGAVRARSGRQNFAELEGPRSKDPDERIVESDFDIVPGAPLSSENSRAAAGVAEVDSLGHTVRRGEDYESQVVVGPEEEFPTHKEDDSGLAESVRRHSLTLSTHGAEQAVEVGRGDFSLDKHGPQRPAASSVDDEDRKVYSDQIRETERLIRRR